MQTTLLYIDVESLGHPALQQPSALDLRIHQVTAANPVCVASVHIASHRCTSRCLCAHRILSRTLRTVCLLGAGHRRGDEGLWTLEDSNARMDLGRSLSAMDGSRRVKGGAFPLDHSTPEYMVKESSFHTQTRPSCGAVLATQK
eukprot:6174027-Pleurochrysis_carterae.AAC.2